MHILHLSRLCSPAANEPFSASPSCRPAATAARSAAHTAIMGVTGRLLLAAAPARGSGAAGAGVPGLANPGSLLGLSARVQPTSARSQSYASPAGSYQLSAPSSASAAYIKCKLDEYNTDA